MTQGARTRKTLHGSIAKIKSTTPKEPAAPVAEKRPNWFQRLRAGFYSYVRSFGASLMNWGR